MLDPNALDTAMFPLPNLATRIDDIASGTEVPTAKMVRPMMCVLTPKQRPSLMANSTMRYEISPIHMIDEKKDTRYQFLHLSVVQSGIVYVNRNVNGYERMITTLLYHLISSSSCCTASPVFVASVALLGLLMLMAVCALPSFASLASVCIRSMAMTPRAAVRNDGCLSTVTGLADVDPIVAPAPLGRWVTRWGLSSYEVSRELPR
mmetsp:Transcript_42421/g.71678  ORF Transcript_42421/g.71678 Transcript_42421/m.71678 type:complete len:206 (+) Transcript_42421:439-1056(+)